jgi:hypothetical protein
MAGFSSRITKINKVWIQQKGKQNIRLWINFILIRPSGKHRKKRLSRGNGHGKGREGHSRAHMGMNRSSKQSRAPPRLLTLCPANNPSETVVNTDYGTLQTGDKPTSIPN